MDGTVDLSRALLTSVATTNISTLQTGLSKQATYWSGVRWILGALEKRIEGFQDVDLGGVTEKLKSLISLPDAGLVGREGDAAREAATVVGQLVGGEGMVPTGSGTGEAINGQGNDGSRFPIHASHGIAQGDGSRPGQGNNTAQVLNHGVLDPLQNGIYSMTNGPTTLPVVAGIGGPGNNTTTQSFQPHPQQHQQQLQPTSSQYPPQSMPSFPPEYDFLSLPFDLGDPEGTQTVTDMPADAWQMDWFK